MGRKGRLSRILRGLPTATDGWHLLDCDGQGVCDCSAELARRGLLPVLEELAATTPRQCQFCLKIPEPK